MNLVYCIDLNEIINKLKLTGRSGVGQQIIAAVSYLSHCYVVFLHLPFITFVAFAFGLPLPPSS